jgi:hypothetical protein
MVAVQELAAPDASVVGLQTSDDMLITGAVRLMPAVFEAPARVAVTVAA